MEQGCTPSEDLLSRKAVLPACVGVTNQCSASSTHRPSTPNLNHSSHSMPEAQARSASTCTQLGLCSSAPLSITVTPRFSVCCLRPTPPASTSTRQPAAGAPTPASTRVPPTNAALAPKQGLDTRRRHADAQHTWQSICPHRDAGRDAPSPPLTRRLNRHTSYPKRTRRGINPTGVPVPVVAT